MGKQSVKEEGRERKAFFGPPELSVVDDLEVVISEAGREPD